MHPAGALTSTIRQTTSPYGLCLLLLSNLVPGVDPIEAAADARARDRYREGWLLPEAAAVVRTPCTVVRFTM